MAITASHQDHHYSIFSQEHFPFFHRITLRTRNRILDDGACYVFAVVWRLMIRERVEWVPTIILRHEICRRLFFFFLSLSCACTIWYGHKQSTDDVCRLWQRHGFSVWRDHYTRLNVFPQFACKQISTQSTTIVLNWILNLISAHFLLLLHWRARAYGVWCRSVFEFSSKFNGNRLNKFCKCVGILCGNEYRHIGPSVLYGNGTRTVEMSTEIEISIHLCCLILLFFRARIKQHFICFRHTEKKKKIELPKGLASMYSACYWNAKDISVGISMREWTARCGIRWPHTPRYARIDYYYYYYYSFPAIPKTNIWE